MGNSQLGIRISVKYAKSTSKITAEALVKKKKRLLDVFQQFEKSSELYLTANADDNETGIGEPGHTIPQSPRKRAQGVEDREEEYLAIGKGKLSDELKEGSWDFGAPPDNDEDSNDDALDPVNTAPSLPSNLDQDELKARGLGHLSAIELELRRTVLGEKLDSLRLVLGQMTACYLGLVRPADTTKRVTRAWAEVNECTRERNSIVRAYCRSREAAINLGISSEELQLNFRPLLPQDLRVSEDLTEFNRYNAKDEKLAWFWQIQKDNNLVEGSVEMKECMVGIQL